MTINNYKLSLKIINPVHIGCDDVFDLTDFYADESGNAIVLYDKKNFIDFLKKNNKINDFYNIIDSNNLSEIAKFINDNAKEIKGKKITCSKTILGKYKECLNGRNFNKFEIKRTVYLAHSLEPYIPGSSVKGAIRMAVIDSLTRNDKYFDLNKYKKNDKNGQFKGYDASKMEKDYLGSFSRDPFSLIKISDFIPKKDVETEIKIAKNFKKNNKEAKNNLYQFVEVITKGEFEGSLSIIENIPNREIKTKLSLEEVLNNCKEFWKNLNNNKDNNCIKIRIGHFCGAENVTISERQIRIKRGKHWNWGKEPTTEWCCVDDFDSDKKYFGICEINITPID